MSVQNFTAAASGEVPEIVSRRRKIFHAHFRSPIMDVTLPILRYISTWKCSSECWLSTGTKLCAIAAWEVRQKCPRNTKIFQKKKTPPNGNGFTWSHSRPYLEKPKAPSCSPESWVGLSRRQNWASWWSLPSETRWRKPIFCLHTRVVFTIKNQSP